MRIVACVIGSSLLVAPSFALADEPRVVRTSYRHYTLLADAVGLGLLVAGAATEGPDGQDTTASGSLMGVGLVSALVATPLIHGLRGHWGRAGGSIGLRHGGAAIGMLIGIAMVSQSCPEEGLDAAFCPLNGVGVGAFGGLVVASLIDAALLTTEYEPAPAWTPQLRIYHGGAQVGFAATF